MYKAQYTKRNIYIERVDIRHKSSYHIYIYKKESEDKKHGAKRIKDKRSNEKGNI